LTNKPKKHSIFSFEGRVDRTTYWITIIGLFFAGFMPAAIVAAHLNEATITLLMLNSILINYIAISVGAKRCHDLGVSGWYQMIPFYVLVMLFSESSDKGDRYGKKDNGVSAESVRLFGILSGAAVMFMLIIILALDTTDGSGAYAGNASEYTDSTAGAEDYDSAWAPADSTADTTGYYY